MSAPRVGDEVTLTGTVRTVEQIVPKGHIRVTLDIAPPKPAEPTGLGAVVEDSDGFRWVRNETPDEPPWRCDQRGWQAWDRVDAVRVLSEGVTA